jgi:hypothetical protein
MQCAPHRGLHHAAGPAERDLKARTVRRIKAGLSTAPRHANRNRITAERNVIVPAYHEQHLQSRSNGNQNRICMPLLHQNLIASPTRSVRGSAGWVWISLTAAGSVARREV